jgi:hypothetical protein
MDQCILGGIMEVSWHCNSVQVIRRWVERAVVSQVRQTVVVETPESVESDVLAKVGELTNRGTSWGVSEDCGDDGLKKTLY